MRDDPESFFTPLKGVEGEGGGPQKVAPATWGAGFHTPLASRSPWPHPLPAIKYAPAHPLAVRHLPALSTLSYVQTLNVYALLSPIGTPHAHLSSAQTHLPFFFKGIIAAQQARHMCKALPAFCMHRPKTCLPNSAP